MKSRTEELKSIVGQQFDLCVIGGGATGAACALDAQLRGIRTVLAEAGDFAGATSSAATKIIHGGVRYNGIAKLDAEGEAEIKLPSYFEALNKDFRYQLTSIGSFAPVYVDREVRNNSFRIAGGNPGGKVPWQVTGIQNDAYVNAHRIVVEENEPSK